MSVQSLILLTKKISKLFSSTQNISIELQDILGRTIKKVFQGAALKGEQNYFFDAADLNSGIYNLVMVTGNEIFCQKAMDISVTLSKCLDLALCN